MREIIIKFNAADYLDFQKIANESSLTVEQKICEIIRYYLIIERNPHLSKKNCSFAGLVYQYPILKWNSDDTYRLAGEERSF